MSGQKIEILHRTAIPIALKRGKLGALKAMLRMKVDVLKSKCLRTVTGVRRSDRVRYDKLETGAVCWKG